MAFIPIGERFDIGSLGELIGRRETVISVSHDDYAAHTGGVQNVVGEEQARFNADGWCYLHLSPSNAKKNVLADEKDYYVTVRLDGRSIAVVRSNELLHRLASLKPTPKSVSLVVHHLMGHAPEFVEQINAALRPDQVFFWVHDQFTHCAMPHLLRNGVTYCDGPPVGSGACGVCAYGSRRARHVERMRKLFAAVRPIVVAPSAEHLARWQRIGSYETSGSVLQPLVRIQPEEELPRAPAEQVRVAHLGACVYAKGWASFERLATTFGHDSRYEFLQFGRPPARGTSLIRNVEVQVSPHNRDAMLDALQTEQVDVAVIWSAYPESFCYTVYEALAAGLHVLTHRAAGNVWRAVEQFDQERGVVFDDFDQLVDFVGGGELADLLSKPRRRGTLSVESGSFPLLQQGMREFHSDAPREKVAQLGA